MTRIGTTGAALLALALLTTGCAGSSKSDGGSSVTVKVPTKAEATAAANAINLVKADFAAGYTSTPADNSDSSDDEDLPKDVATCLGVDTKEFSKDDSLVDLSSDDFSKGAPPNGAQVSSEVQVVASIDKAKKELALFSDSKTPDCLKKTFEKQFKDEIGGAAAGLTLGTLDIKKLDVPSDGTDGSFGFALTLPVNGPGISIKVATEIRGFLKKHTEVTLLTVTYGDTASVDSADLYGKLVTRAKASAV